MRNCLYMGSATKFLKSEANSDIFLKSTGRSLQKSTMRDREMINRFCAFKLLPISSYRGDMDAFLALALEKMNTMDSKELELISTQFRTSLRNNFTVFGNHAFRKFAKGQESRSVFNASLWDVMSTGLSEYAEHVVEAKADLLRESFWVMLEDTEFNSSITLGTNQVNRVMCRFNRTRQMLVEVFDA